MQLTLQFDFYSHWISIGTLIQTLTCTCNNLWSCVPLIIKMSLVSDFMFTMDLLFSCMLLVECIKAHTIIQYSVFSICWHKLRCLLRIRWATLCPTRISCLFSPNYEVNENVFTFVMCKGRSTQNNTVGKKMTHHMWASLCPPWTSCYMYWSTCT